jgi:hypothetical protein
MQRHSRTTRKSWQLISIIILPCNFLLGYWSRRRESTEGVAILEKLGEGSESSLGYAYAKAGRRDDAETIAAQHRDWPWLQAVAYGGLGDKERAYEGLKQMVAINAPRASNYLDFPELSLLRGDPRLEEIRRSLSLPKHP